MIAAVLVLPLFVARDAMERAHQNIGDLRQNEFRASLMLGNVRDALAVVADREKALGLVKSDTVYQQLQRALNTATSLSSTLQRAVGDSSSENISNALSVIAPAVDREYDAIKANNVELADSISHRVIQAELKLAFDAVDAEGRMLRVQTDARVERTERDILDAKDVTLASLAIALALATGIALWLTRYVTGPVRDLERGMDAVAGGELNHALRIDAARPDEFGRLAASFQEMTRQLRELDKLKAEFVSIASHELKTPINVILGYISLLQEKVYGPLTEKQAPVIGTIETQTKTLARLATQLLDVSRFEAGGGRIEPRPIRLRNMLDDLERTFHVLAVQREIKFDIHHIDPLPEEVNWDPERINEVTGNLLSNAFKFTKPGGRVELTAGPHENGVCIEVKDTGAGIPPDQLQHVFDKFYQADNQKSASAKGTGLGLAIAKEIVEAHQGHITCDSKLGEGTTFTIVLPLRVINRRRSKGFLRMAPGSRRVK
jgi:signal transduction histidine kinase